MEDSQQKDYSFLGTLRSPVFTMLKFMNENLRVNIWRDNFQLNFTSEPSIEKLFENNTRNNKSDLSKFSTLSEPSIVKFIENQSEHLSKLT